MSFLPSRSSLPVAVVSFWILLGTTCLATEPPSLADILRPLKQRELPTRPVTPPAPERPAAPRPSEDPAERIIGLEDVVHAMTVMLNRKAAVGERIEINSAAKWTPVSLNREAKCALSIKNRFEPDDRGRWTAHIILRAEGNAVGSWHLPVQTTSYRRVWVAVDRIAEEVHPAPPLIRAAEYEVTRLPANAVPARVELFDYELVRPLAKGRILTWEDVRLRPAVRRGEVVQVTVSEGALRITMPALALEDARQGERIRLRNVDSGRVISGTVTEDNQVRVDLKGNG